MKQNNHYRTLKVVYSFGIQPSGLLLRAGSILICGGEASTDGPRVTESAVAVECARAGLSVGLKACVCLSGSKSDRVCGRVSQ